MEWKPDVRGGADTAPLFSVIVLTYLQRHLLNDCLDSIFAQAYPNIELVVCDDCSADFDEEEVRAYIDAHKGENIRRVVVHKQPKNVGIAQNAQAGVELSTGTFFKLHAGDDRLYDETVLEKAARHLSDPAVSVVAASSIACQYDGTMTVYHYPEEWARNCVLNADAQTQFNLLATQGWQDYFHAPAMFWRRSFFDALGGFDLSYRYEADWHLLLKATASGQRITTVDDIAVIFRYGGPFNSGDPADQSLKNEYYRECARMLRQYGLAPFEVSGDRKKVIRCKQAIRCLENRLVAENDWGSWTVWQQLLWRVKNLDFLLLSWLYRKRQQGASLTHVKGPALVMALCVVFYVFGVELIPGRFSAFLWSALFFILALWLLLKIVGVCCLKLMRAVLSARGRRG